MIIRLLIFLLSAIFAAGAVNLLLRASDPMLIQAFGLKISIHSGIAILCLVTILVVLVFGISFFKDLMSIPRKIRERQAREKQTRGMAALTRGMEAIAIGDSQDALHHAKIARRNLGEGSITRLLSAQAAQLSGDDEAAGESFTAMLDAPETEFLGLRGLYAKAMRADDKDGARAFADRAFRLRPNAHWAFESVFDLALDRGAWGDARAALAPALKNKTIENDRGQRAEAALFAATAHDANAANDKATALEDAEKALKLAPGLTPAAVLAAELHHAGGRTARATKILENAFAAAPQISIISALIKLTPAVEDRVNSLQKLAQRAPQTRAGQIAQVRGLILQEEYTKARETLEPMLAEAASASDCALMAEALRGAHGEAAAKPWLARALTAPRDHAPGADGVFRLTRDGWAQLIRCFMNDQTLSPAPIEERPSGISGDELRLLAPPEPIPASPEDSAPPQEQTAKSDRPAALTDETKIATAPGTGAPAESGKSIATDEVIEEADEKPLGKSTLDKDDISD